MLKQYQAEAVYSETKKKRKVTFIAQAEEDVINLLNILGYLEPYQISELAPKPPTQKQIDYAKDLKITIPPDASGSDVSALISSKLDGDISANIELMMYAQEKGLKIAKYIGAKGLYDSLYEHLNLNDKIAFFIFSVYRQLSGDTSNNLNKHVQKDAIYNYAIELKKNEKVLKSLLGYSGRDLMHFGKILYADNLEVNGGSVNTYAYKEVSTFISKTYSTTKTKKIVSDRTSGLTSSDESKTKGKKGGCFAAALIILLLLFLLY
jgi:hypothetical protein